MADNKAPLPEQGEAMTNYNESVCGEHCEMEEV